jgi:hypothetical protein
MIGVAVGIIGVVLVDLLRGPGKPSMFSRPLAWLRSLQTPFRRA